MLEEVEEEEEPLLRSSVPEVVSEAVVEVRDKLKPSAASKLAPESVGEAAMASAGPGWMGLEYGVDRKALLKSFRVS